jgi:hypothetical protein
MEHDNTSPLTMDGVRKDIRRFLAVARDFAKTRAGNTITRRQAQQLCEDLGIKPQLWFEKSEEFKTEDRATYRVPMTDEEFLTVYTKWKQRVLVAFHESQAKATMNSSFQQYQHHFKNGSLELGANIEIPDIGSLVPDKNPNYVPWGHYNDIKRIITSRTFMPTFIEGPSGNGKTEMALQICAELGRECMRINFTDQTDEDALLYSTQLRNGNTVTQIGPIPIAMMRGTVTLLDEIDLGGKDIMCLQPVLEGKPLFLKRIGKTIYPAPGFQIIATGNTKGLGDETGKFAHTQIMNEAFLERFPLMFIQDYPPPDVETKILTSVLASKNLTNDTFVASLVKWAGQIRDLYQKEPGSDVMTTRRLIWIVDAWAIFQDEDMAVRLTVNRFDPTTIDGFMKQWDANKPAKNQKVAAAKPKKNKTEGLDWAPSNF